MEVTMSDTEYNYPEEDVKGMLIWLQVNVPKHATPEKAIFLLEQQKVHYEKLEELYPEVVEAILKDFEER